MPSVFQNPFRVTVQEELERRRTFNTLNDVFVPSARVTSLVHVTEPVLIGGIQLSNIKGFSIGITANSGNTLDSLLNINNSGVVIGTTYSGNVPSNVVIPGPINMPSPGITDIRVSTNKGLIFKAEFSLKFYGKQQYDVLYQLLMRPGMPIVIEFGHARSKDNNDLGFFDTLDAGTIDSFKSELRLFKPIVPTSANFASFTGFVTNFNISLNDQNEYEATVELTNGLEYMFSLPLEETYIDFRNTDLSKSIKNNFGYFANDDDGTYSPKYDCAFNTIQADLRSEQWNEHILWPNIQVDSGDDALDVREFYNVEMQNVYISLNYIFAQNGLLSKVLKHTDGRTLVNIPNLNHRDVSGDAKVPLIELTDIPWWNTLRSTNINRVIINNSNLHQSTHIQYFGSRGATGGSPLTYRLSDYEKRFEDQFEPAYIYEMFNAAGKYADKKMYGPPSPESEKNFTKNEGIFVSYDLVRNSFISSNTLSDAIINILNAVNSATVDILQLRLQIQRKEEHEDRIGEDKLIIYDERSKVRDVEQNRSSYYKFFKDNISEAISYDFDFSLPASVASTVVANNASSRSHIVGNSEYGRFIRNGYVSGIDAIPEIQLTENKESIQQSQQLEGLKCNSNFVFPSEESKEASTSEEEKFEQAIARLEDEYSRESVAFREYVPQGMKSQLIDGVGPSGSVIPDKLMDTLPTGANVSIKLQGIHGFRFGDLFEVDNVLPYPYSDNNIFFVTSYEHDVSSQGWYTTLKGQYITISNVQTFNETNISNPPSPSETTVSTIGRDHSTQGLDPRLLEAFNIARDTFGDYRVRLVSAYRTPEVNAAAGGVQNSNHLCGKAIDFNIYIPEGDRWRLISKQSAMDGDHYSLSLHRAFHQKVAIEFNMRNPGVKIDEWLGRVDPNHIEIDEGCE